MSVLVTGASGFLGHAVTTRLRAVGHDLVLPSRRAMPGGIVTPPLEDMTVTDWHPLLAGVDAVVHCAAIAHIGPDVSDARYMAVNRDASAVLARAAAEAGVRCFVFLSSIRAQVGATSIIVQDEHTPPAPTEAYGASKLAAEHLTSQAFPAATHLRPPLIIGDAPKGNLALMLRLAHTGLPLPFADFTAPQAVVSRDNLIDAIVLALEGDALSGGTYVIADEPHPGIADMLGWMREGLGQPRRLFQMPPALLRLPAAALGKADVFERLTGGLRVDASRLRAAGWTQRLPTADAFRALARADHSGG